MATLLAKVTPEMLFDIGFEAAVKLEAGIEA